MIYLVVGGVLVLIIGLILCLLFYCFNSSIFFPKIFRQGSVESHNHSGIDYLIQHGLPVQTHFKDTNREQWKLGDWLFSHDGQEWKDIKVPHCFNTQSSNLCNYTGAVWYKTTLDFNETIMGQEGNLHLVFGGSFYRTRVWLDGELIGDHEGGYQPFRFNISNYMNNGSCQLKVEVDNRLDYDTLPPLPGKGLPLGWHPYGGLHKPVYMELCPKAYCFKAHVKRLLGVGKPAVEAQLLFQGELEDLDVQLTIKHKEQVLQEKKYVLSTRKSIGALKVVFLLDKIVKWDFKRPYLYTLDIRTPYEKLSIRFGYRIVERRYQHVYLNGHKVAFKGVNRHEEDAYEGLAQSKDHMLQDLDLIEELGANFIRLAHYPHDSYFLDQCDERGICLWSEIPLYQAGLAPVKYLVDKSKENRDPLILRILKVPKVVWMTRQLREPVLLQKARDELLIMIERNYNHPSIAVWGIGNECWTFNKAGGKVVKYLQRLVKERDASRLIGYAAMTIPGVTMRYERSFEVMDLLCINQYYGWYYGKIHDVSAFIDGLQKKYGKKPFMITEMGADCLFGFHSGEVPSEKNVTEEYQSRLIQEQYDILKQKEGFSGMNVWVLKDFYCPEYGSDNPLPYYNLKGLVDKDYNKKKAFETVKDLYSDIDFKIDEHIGGDKQYM